MPRPFRRRHGDWSGGGGAGFGDASLICGGLSCHRILPCRHEISEDTATERKIIQIH